MPKNQLIDLFSTPTNTLVNIKKPANNHIEEIKPMKQKEETTLKKLKCPLSNRKDI